MAYIIMTDDEEYVDGTWEPDGGENAVIIQPGGIPAVKVKNISTGPTLQNYVEVEGTDRLQPVDVEIKPNLILEEDPEFISDNELMDLSEEVCE